MRSLLWLCVLSVCALEVIGQHDGSEVYTAEQFEELVLQTDGSGLLAKDTVLCMHTDACSCEMNNAVLPSAKYLFALRYNKDAYARNVWYEPGPAGTLHERFWRSDACMEVVFFKAGEQVNSRGDYWERTQDPDVNDWIIDHTQMDCQVTNAYPDDIAIFTENLAGEILDQKYQLKRRDKKTINCQPGTVLVFTAKTRIVGVSVAAGDCQISVHQNMPVLNVEERRFQELKDIDHSRQGMYLMGHRTLLNIRQPRILPNFTTTGYKQVKMPNEMLHPVRNMFFRNYKAINDESRDSQYNAVNIDSTQSKLIPLDKEIVHLIIRVLQPRLEEWCSCSIEYKIAYGIREYYGGNILYNHVDITETHIISAILQIDQDLVGPDWPLEVIGYDGKRHNISMAIGDMVFYESARLIHGRPTYFKGHRYANAFFHFAPKGWKYKVHGFIANPNYHLDKIMLKDFANGVETRLLPFDAKTVKMSSPLKKEEL